MFSFQDKLREQLDLATQQYHRLIIILNPESRPTGIRSDKTVEQLGLVGINLGLTLSQKLLELTERQRALRLPQMVEQILVDNGDQPVFMDHIEILFSPALKQDPLRLLQGLSRNRTIVVMWNGQVTNGSLIYASPEHPEYRKYPAQDLNILPLSDI